MTVPTQPREKRRPATLLVVVAVAVGAAALLGVFVLSLGTTPWLSQPCGACHEIGPKVQTWGESPHARVGCYPCHEPANPTYGLGQRVTDRFARLGRDVYQHVTGTDPSPADAPPGSVAPISDTVCTGCHDPNRKPTSRGGVIIDHAEHARMNDSCLSCHINTAHPDPSQDQALVMMKQCYECHGTGENAKAPGACDTCHPDFFDLPPSNHKATTWRIAHGESAKTDRGQCAMCHEQSFCDDCHGVEIPHPEGWVEGATGHGSVARLDRSVCARCHEGKTDPCNTCHHKRYGEKGRWIDRHPDAVSANGTADCFACHEALFCANCHKAARSTQ